MENVYYLLVFFLCCWYFIYLRKVSESAKRFVVNYCKTEKLQFIAIARRSSRLKISKKYGFCLFSTFDFEFSGDGESSNQGCLTLFGLKLDNIDLPAYRVS
jgi:hypothetical protein